MSQPRLWPLVLLVAAPPALARVDEPGPALDVETIVNLRTVADAQIDPTGQRIAYVLTVPRGDEDEPGPPFTEIWIAALDGDEPRRFSPERSTATTPRWSSDGDTLGYIAPSDEGWPDTTARQVHLIAVDGGASWQVTWQQTDVADFRFAPGDQRIAFAAADAPNEQREAEAEEGRDWIVAGADEALTRLWIADLESGAAERLFDDDLSVDGFAWTPDGAGLVFTAATAAGPDAAMMDGRIYRARLDGAAPQVVCPTQGKLGALAISPDGATLAFMGATSLNDPLPQSLFVTPLDGSAAPGAARNLTQGAEASVTAIDWTADGRILALADEGTTSTLHVVDPATGARTAVLAGALAARSMSFAAQAGRLALVHSTPAHPNEVAVGSLADDGVLTVTDHNAVLAECDLAATETIEWQSPGGMRIEGVLTWPVGYEPGTRYPLVVNPHGGPEGTSLNGWSDFAQLLAARGYVVLQPNYRGSGGRGVAFSKGDHEDLGGREFDDILAGIDLLVQRGIADGDRVGMAGWSYGGYLSALAATHHSDRFKAAVMGAGISNWLSFTGTTDIPREMSTVHWSMPMDGNEPLYWQRSPLSAIAAAQTPTLILFGADDERVPPSQGRELYRALKNRGVDTEMVLYPRSGHGVRERAHRRDLYERQLEWMDRYLK